MGDLGGRGRYEHWVEGLARLGQELAVLGWYGLDCSEYHYLGTVRQ